MSFISSTTPVKMIFYNIDLFGQFYSMNDTNYRHVRYKWDIDYIGIFQYL